MPINLTDATINSLKYEDSTKVHWDKNLPGFGVRVGKHTKTFIVCKGQKRIHVAIGRYPETSLKAARAFALAQMAKDPNKLSLTVPEAISRFTEHCKPRLKPATLDQYLFYLRTMDFQGRVEDITSEAVQRALETWNGKPYSQNYAWAALRNFFNWLIEHGHLEKSPIFRQMPPNKVRSRDRVLSDEELARIWRTADDGSAYANIIRMLILTGQRRTEVGNLKLEDVQDGVITFHTKGDRINLIPVTPMMEPYLKQLPFKFNNWGDCKAKFDTDCMVEGWRHHDLRRTLATKMASLGVPFIVIEKILGHSVGRIASIYQRYGYLKEMKEALELYHAHIQKIIKAEERRAA